MRLPVFCLVLSAACPTWAADFRLDWPVDCELGETCDIQQYVDRDPGPAAVDFTGGPLSYDGHTGTDIRIPDVADMGTVVRTVAPGTVRAVRDGEDDAFLTPERRQALAGRGCGNGVVVDHGGGWQTQYCHLLKGSIAVAKGDRIARGTELGQIGLSGFTDFPHLELIVRKDGEVVDPFDPDDTDVTLWRDNIPYVPGGVMDVGFASAVPEYQDIRDGTANAVFLPSDAPALVAWAFVFGAREGDNIQIKITSPDGSVFIDRTDEVTRNRAQLFRATGRSLRAAAWPEGVYFAEASLLRDGVIVDMMEATISVD